MKSFVVSMLTIALFVLVLYLSALILAALFVNPRKEYVYNNRFYRWLLNSATAIALKIMRIKIHVSGLEKVPQGMRLLFISNHCSNFDPIVTWHVFKDWQIAFLSKASNFKVPLFGRIIRKCCFMPVDRENAKNALKTFNKAADLLKAQEVSIGVYPEGTRSKNGQLLPFHNGVFKIAQRGEAPVVICAIRGTNKISKNYPWHTSHIYLDVLDVVSTEEVMEMRTAAIGERARGQIANCLKQEGEN